MAPPLRSIGSDAGKSLVRRLVFAIVLVAGSSVLLSSCLTRIDAAHVGIRVNFSGSNRGVDDIPTVTGWVPYNPLTEQIIMFPTSVQNVVWTKDIHEGSPHDESITFSSEEGVNVNADIGLSFHIEPRLAPRLYMRFRKNDLLDLADGYVRNSVREAFNVVASKMQVQDIYGAEKGKLEAEVRRRVQEQLGQDGFVIDQLTINGALRLPDTFLTAINRAMEQKQQSMQAQNKVAQVEAEARQAVAQAEGQAKAARLRAEGEAAARIITARAEARANLLLRRSMSPSMMQYRALEKWNGRLPVMNGGGQLPMLTFDTSKLAKEDDADLAKLMKEIDAEDAAEQKIKADTAAADAPRDAAKEAAKDPLRDAAKDAPKDAAKPEEPKADAPKK